MGGLATAQRKEGAVGEEEVKVREREEMGRLALNVYFRTLDRLNEVLQRIEDRNPEEDQVAPLVGILRGVDIAVKALQRTTGESAKDLEGTLAGLVREWEDLKRSCRTGVEADPPTEDASAGAAPSAAPSDEGRPKDGRAGEAGSD